MATSDRDILITPNTSTSNDPKIEFKGGGTLAGSASTITMVALAKTAHEGVIDIRATDGDTIASFSETNTGTLFSVSDDSGSAKFQVHETGVVDTSLSSGALGLPVGLTSERPPDPSAGFMRWNSTSNSMEVYNGTDWAEVIIDYTPSGSTILG
tara:strand:+ start:633 stop:1094 length:462 start_codon:yes stop_codon:yes gene_type:complete